MLQSSTLRPGLLVSLKTTISGNVSYVKQTIEGEHYTATGEQKAKWETERTISDPAEHESAVKARTVARTAITRVCSASAFGLLCPEAKAPELESAIAEARAVADTFNATARLTRLSVYVVTGRIAPDDVEAVRAINSEVRDLMERMLSGIQNLDVAMVREAANKARGLGQMLTPNAAERIQGAIDVARAAARKIVAAGESAAVEIDNATLARLAEARTAFLDISDAVEVQKPDAEPRAIDFEPEGQDRESYSDTQDRETYRVLELD